MQIVPYEDNLHDTSSPIFSEKYIKIILLNAMLFSAV